MSDNTFKTWLGDHLDAHPELRPAVNVLREAKRFQVTAGKPGSPAEGKDRVLSNHLTRNACIDRARDESRRYRRKMVWAWEEVRPQSWQVMATFKAGEPWVRPS